jgi:NAD(P)-dependent dehydrogenase (short-subunit alcohol dehydrogenase family)
MDLAGKTIVITGGARGLGAAMARRLAAAGSRLALVDLDESALQATAEECRTAGASQAQGYVANVAKETEVEALFDSIVEDFGEIHGLVNNAGIIRDAMMLKYKDGKQVSKMTLDQCASSTFRRFPAQATWARRITRRPRLAYRRCPWSGPRNLRATVSARHRSRRGSSARNSLCR